MNGVEMMNSTFGSSGSFGSRVRSTCFGHNKYRGIRRNFHSKPTPIHEPVHKYELNLSYSIRKFSTLPQAVS